MDILTGDYHHRNGPSCVECESNIYWCTKPSTITVTRLRKWVRWEVQFCVGNTLYVIQDFRTLISARRCQRVLMDTCVTSRARIMRVTEKTIYGGPLWRGL